MTQSGCTPLLDGERYTIRGRKIKLKNRRVWLGKTKDGGYAVMTKALIPAESRKDRISTTETVWTEDGLKALIFLFLEENGRII